MRPDFTKRLNGKLTLKHDAVLRMRRAIEDPARPMLSSPQAKRPEDPHFPHFYASALIRGTSPADYEISHGFSWARL
jgi:hypothetical protein